ncbi:MAG: hypothetical protein CL858_27920 [Cupriavidus sp.]|nr:hypothetical protein [Cupriavidus sp.]
MKFAAYSTHYHRLDMLAHVAMRQGAGHWLDSNEALSRQALLRSEFYTDPRVPDSQAHSRGTFPVVSPQHDL